MAKLTINGEQKSFDAPPDMPLLWVLRDILGLTGTKFGCGIAQCGACTVHIDGKSVRSCMLAVRAQQERAPTPLPGIGGAPPRAEMEESPPRIGMIPYGACQTGPNITAAAPVAPGGQTPEGANR